MSKTLLCDKDKTLLEAMQIINENGKGIVFIVDKDKRVEGALTDGDARRALLGGKELQQKVCEAMNKNFAYALSDESYEEMIKKTDSNIKILPILNKDFKYIDYFEYSSSLFFPVAAPEFLGNEFKYLTEAFLSTWISSSGKYINLFEEKFAEFCGVKYAVAVSNGTTALHLAFLALDIGEGDEVIAPDLTFAATINTIIHAKATPVIVDIEEDSWCIDPDEIEKSITKKTKAIVPVHLYGQPANMDKISALAKKYNLYVIEDAAEAHGAVIKNKKVGSIGDIGCFSFFGNKVITTGEGGMCVTNSKEIADKIRILKDHGMSKTRKYWHDTIGYNYRMTNLQASIGLAQMERVAKILENRKDIEDTYKEQLKDLKNITWQKNDFSDRQKITWLVSVLTDEKYRDKIITELKESGIDTRPFFYSLGEMEIYKKFVFSNKRSKSISKRGINFPTVPNLDDQFFHALRSVLEKYNDK